MIKATNPVLEIVIQAKILSPKLHIFEANPCVSYNRDPQTTCNMIPAVPPRPLQQTCFD